MCLFVFMSVCFVCNVCTWAVNLIFDTERIWEQETLNATLLSSAEQKILDIITHIEVIIIRAKCQIGKSNNPCKTCNLSAVRAQCSPLSLFSAVVQSQRPCLPNFPDIYEMRLGGIFAIRAKHTSKSHYARRSKPASTLDLKISVGKEHWCIFMSTSCLIFI